MKPSRKPPTFKTPAEETAFWNQPESSTAVDWSHARVGVFPDLKPTTQSISIRLPKALIEELKVLAHKQDVPYQSLLKIYLSERVQHEYRALQPVV